MPAWGKRSAAVALLLLAGMAQASAQGGFTYTAKSGQKTSLGFFANCTTHAPPTVVLDPPMHGTATATMIRANSCGDPDEPVVVILYQSDAGFKGTDVVTAYVGVGSQETQMVVTVQ